MLAAHEMSSVEDSELTRKFAKSKNKKLSKTRKLSKFQKLIRSKKLLKSENSPKFYAKKTKSSFLISKARAIFNC